MKINNQEFSTKEKLEELLRIATEDERFITKDKSEKLNCHDYPLDKLMKKFMALPEEDRKKINTILSAEQKLDILEKLFLNFTYNITPCPKDFKGKDYSFGEWDTQYNLKKINKFKTEDKETIEHCFYQILNFGECYSIGRLIDKYLSNSYQYTKL